ncbi:MAG TPA: DUF2934 domain-containing protein [Casimicrobiaceae bacterium]|nr:DUF2934 domain-containing protein [Casimicrobiaceae bacterium]
MTATRKPTRNFRTKPTPPAHVVPNHPRSVPIIEPESESEELPDQPFAEGGQDSLDADLRHRMISEAAFHRYAERGYADGYDMDDWLQAEAEVDHLLVNRERGETSRRGG